MVFNLYIANNQRHPKQKIGMGNFKQFVIFFYLFFWTNLQINTFRHQLQKSYFDPIVCVLFQCYFPQYYYSFARFSLSPAVQVMNDTWR